MTADYCQRSGQHKQGSNCSQTSPQSPHNPLALSQPPTLFPLLFPLAHRLQIYPALLCGSLGFSLTLSTLLLCPLLSLHWHHLSFLKTAQESVSPCTRHAFSLPWPANVPGAGHLSLTAHSSVHLLQMLTHCFSTTRLTDKCQATTTNAFPDLTASSHSPEAGSAAHRPSRNTSFLPEALSF